MPTSKLNLTLQNIGQIDRGRVALALNHALRTAISDLTDRPGDKTKRKVTLVVEMSPQLDRATGALDVAQLQFQVKTSVPNRRSSSYPMLPMGEGVLCFEPESPFDPRQGSFAFGKAANTQTVDPQTGEVLSPGKSE